MEELIKKAKNGNTDAFSSIILNIQEELYKIARMRLSSQEDINDAIQETIIKAYTSIHNLKHIKYFKTWIIKILINECNKVYKLDHSNYNSEINDKEEYYSSNKKSDIEKSIDRLDFDMLISYLNYEERTIVTLFYLEGFKTKEIASILEIKDNNVKVKLSRARNKIKKIMEGEKSYE